MKPGTWLGVPAAILVAVGVAGWLSKPVALRAPMEQVVIQGDPARYLAAGEDAIARRSGIVPDTEKRIRWAEAAGQRSEYVVVYLHGFSATRQEIAPVPSRVARALGANLFETRLTGHGLERDRLEGVDAQDWLADGAEALAVARALGDRIVLMGTSTGATLAVALARHPDFRHVESLVLLSPNWGPAAEGADIATGPFGPQLMRLFTGTEHSWEAANAAQERFWTTRYPTAAIVEMMRLVDLARTLTAEAVVPAALLVYSPLDGVVSIDRLTAGFATLPSKRKAMYRMDAPQSLSTHVLTGDILAPAETQPVTDRIVAFLRN